MSLRDLTPDLLDHLRTELSCGTLRELTPAYLSEPRGQWQGAAAAVLAPPDTEEVARIVRFANRHRIAVVPWSGGTGLVGGQVMPNAPAPILVSLERMTGIRGVYPGENALVVYAGAILADVQAAAEEAGRLFPLSLASEGSARVGGVLSTNAGGVNVLRYGNARDLALGIEAVLPSGEILRGLKRLRKDNTGYDLRHLLIGAEGTLGIITAAALRLLPRPERQGMAMMAVASPKAALDLLNIAQRGEGLSMFELISGQGLRFLIDTGLPVRSPFAAPPEWCVLIDLGLSAEADPQAQLEAIFAEGVEAGLVSDGIITQSDGQRQSLRAVRENIPEANKRIGAIVSNDIALPLSEIPGFLKAMPAVLNKIAPVRVNCFGHLGDGNLHYNLFPAEGRAASEYGDYAPALRAAVDAEAMSRGGSFSAEHGIGRLKVETLERYGDPAKLAAMRAIKRALDPLGIMNPGAVLRA